MEAADLGNALSCSICLKIYTDPVSLPCGHSFCQGCIGTTWDTQEVREGYSCPECKAEYQERPALYRNKPLGKIAEQFLSTNPDQDGTGVSRNKRCSAQEILNYHCTEDGACVTCCQAGDHRDHKVQVLNVATSLQREKSRNILEDLHQEREVIKKETAQSLQECNKEKELKAAGETKRVTAQLRDIREQLRSIGMQRLSDISRQREPFLLPFMDPVSQLEIRRYELSRKIDNIEELCNIEDLLTFLQTLEVAGAEGADNGDRETNEINAPAVGNQGLGQILETFRTSLAGIMADETKMTRYGKRVTNLVLYRKMAGTNICISKDRKLAYHADNIQKPYIEEHYKDAQVLSTTIFTSGHHYWDVKGSELGDIKLGVVYTSIENRGTQPWIGYNNKSWCLIRCVNNSKYLARHNNVDTELPHVPSCRIIRISLNYEAGKLSFYELSEPIRLLHTFTATFTEPLHAAFWVWRWESNEAWVKIIS